MLPPDANVLESRLIDSLKNVDTSGEMVRVRYVAQGFGDKDKPVIVHKTSSLHASSIQLILSVAAAPGF